MQLYPEQYSQQSQHFHNSFTRELQMDALWIYAQLWMGQFMLRIVKRSPFASILCWLQSNIAWSCITSIPTEYFVYCRLLFRSTILFLHKHRISLCISTI